MSSMAPTTLRCALERRRGFLAALGLAALADQLLNGGHGNASSLNETCEIFGIGRHSGARGTRVKASGKAYERDAPTSTVRGREIARPE